MKKLTIVFVAMTLYSCQFFVQKENNIPDDVADSLEVVSELATEITGENNPNDEKKIWVVTDVNGTFFKKEPDPNSENVRELPYGQVIESEEEVGDFFKLINYSTGYYAYVQKSKLGKVKDLFIRPNKLYENEYSWEGEEDFQTENAKNPQQFISLELINEKTYKQAQKKAVNFFLPDTLSITKKGRVLALPCLDSIVKYEDSDAPPDSDSYSFYKYEGQIKELNLYVVRNDLYEEGRLLLVNKKTGKEKDFTEIPYFSPNKKYLIDLAPHHDYNVAELSLYSVDNNLNIKRIYTAGFTEWMPLTWDLGAAFWSADGYFYFPALYRTKYFFHTYEYERQSSYPFEYIRLRVK